MRPFLKAWEKGDYRFQRVALGLLILLTLFFSGSLIPFVFYPPHEGMTLRHLVDFFGENTFFILQMIPSLLGLLGFVALIKFVHKSKASDWIHGREKLDFKRVFFGFFLWGVLLISGSIIDWIARPDLYHWNFKLGPFLESFVLLLFFLPFQVLFEELLFRSYTLQGLAKRTGSPLIAVTVSGLMFGLMHLGNPEIQSQGLGILSIYILLGVFLSLLAALDNGIELSLGFHLGNNFFTGIWVTSEDQAFQTNALLSTNAVSFDFNSVLGLILGLLLFFVLAFRHYQWSFTTLKRNFN